MSVSALVMLGAILLLVAGLWFSARDVSASMKKPTASAKVLGNCGDTMELGLTIVGGRVTKVECESDGCRVSQKCIEAAALLARGKTVPELEVINMMNIIDAVGEIPDDHLHCAQLAETTLRYALKSHRSGKMETATGM